MSKTKISNKNLGIVIVIGLIIEFVLPSVGLGKISMLGTLIYLLVAIYLIFM